MDLLQALHMNKGEGENSYAMNSSVQRGIISSAEPMIRKALEDYFSSAVNEPAECFCIADLGCSSGPNTWKVVSEIIDDVVYGGSRARHLPEKQRTHTARQLGELVVYLNDLPGNDFNAVFASLPDFYDKLRREKVDEFCPCFVTAVPGSFYGRLVPSNRLHFVHSSSSLHWLSKVPPILEATKWPRLNKGKIFISKSSSEHVVKAYSSQFREDFYSFLRSRSTEVVPRGCMVLTLAGRRSADPTVEEDSYLQWDLLARSLMTLVSELMYIQGLLEEDKVDSFNVPYYATSTEELTQVVEKEGSFEVQQLHIFEIDWDGRRGEITPPENGNQDVDDGTSTVLSRGQKISKIHRAVVEGMFQDHFGKEIMDRLFSTYAQMVDSSISQRDSKFTSLTVYLVKKSK